LTTTTTTTTTTMMTTTSQVRDPCSTLTCRHGARCVVEHGTPRCRCQPSDCSSSSLNDGPVCGSDRRDYSSECEMKSVSCRQQKHIGKLYDGFCGNVIQHFPLDIFPRTFPSGHSPPEHSPPGQCPFLFTWCRTFSPSNHHHLRQSTV